MNSVKEELLKNKSELVTAKQDLIKAKTDMENLSVGKDKGQHKLLETKENEIKKLNSKIESLETDVEKLMFEKAALEKVLIFT